MILIMMKMNLKLLSILDFWLKALTKELSEELMLAVWHPKRWWNFSC